MRWPRSTRAPARLGREPSVTTSGLRVSPYMRHDDRTEEVGAGRTDSARALRQLYTPAVLRPRGSVCSPPAGGRHWPYKDNDTAERQAAGLPLRPRLPAAGPLTRAVTHFGFTCTEPPMRFGGSSPQAGSHETLFALRSGRGVDSRLLKGARRQRREFPAGDFKSSDRKGRVVSALRLQPP